MNSYIKTDYNQPFIEQRADPYILKAQDGYYYFTASVPQYDRIILRRGKTLRELKYSEERTLWRKHESGKQSIHIWAPEIHYINNRWYIYYAAGDKNDIWAIRPYVLECTGDDPYYGQWEEMGQVQPSATDEFSFRNFSLDMTVFEHKNRLYSVWAEKTGVGKMISNLYIAEMETPWSLKTQQVLLTTPDYPWERIGFWVNEGPAIIKKNNKIYLTYSASATGDCYSMGLLQCSEASDLLDPLSWKKSRSPILVSDHQKGIYGPGHNSFTKSEDGTEDLLVYHARQYKEIEGDPLYDPNRHTMVMKIEWKDGDELLLSYDNNVKIFG